MVAVLLLRLLLLWTQGTTSTDPDKDSNFTFIGQDRWGWDCLELCEWHGRSNDSLFCYTNVYNYQRLNVEVLSEDPVLIVFRKFASDEEVAGVLEDVKKEELHAAKVVDQDAEGVAAMEGPGRRTNVTFVAHEKTARIALIFRRAKAMIPFVKFENSEIWQILSYHPGGHYAPHWDYLFFKSEEQKDVLSKEMGNRFATFLFSLQSASKGGGTVFPEVGITVMPTPGDAVFFTNMHPDESLDKNSLHGACVVREGVKIAMVLWIRSKDQDLLRSPLRSGRFDINKLIRPNLYFLGKTPIYE